MRLPPLIGLVAAAAVFSCGGAETIRSGGTDGGSQPDRPMGSGGTSPAGNGGAGGTAAGGAGGVVIGAGGGAGDGGGGGAAGGGVDAGVGSGGSTGGGGSGTGGGAGGGSGGGAGGAVACAGNAVQFDGVNDYLSVARQVQDDFTIEGWIKTSATSLTGTRFWEGNGLFYADVMGAANDFGVSVLGNKIAFGAGNNALVQSTSSVNTGLWVHVAAVRTRSTGTVAVLVNGVLETSMASTVTTSLTSPTTITFGGNTVDGRYFNGVVDELRIWSVARTPADVQSTMGRRLTGTEAGLVGYWRFDELGGSTFADSSPSANTAVATAGNDAGATAPLHVVSDAPICP